MTRILLNLTLLISCTTTCMAQDNGPVEISDDGKAITINIASKAFTTYDYSSHKKPIFYPIYGPDQISMTRNFPMVKDKPGEANDHPHHKSMWLGHEINGIDFWTEKGGSVKHVKHQLTKTGFNAEHRWVDDKTNQTVLTDKIIVRFGGNSRYRFIDYQTTFQADEKPVEFEDTKEGTFAVRVHPQLRTSPAPERGVESVTGKMKNSNGTTGKKIWGQKAKWVSYFGRIEGKKCGITIFDHPSNFRHPTTWHARDYGLFAANPFGLHYFEKKKKGAGKFVIEPNETLTLRYHVIFHLDHWDDGQIEREFEEFASTD